MLCLQALFPAPGCPGGLRSSRDCRMKPSSPFPACEVLSLPSSAWPLCQPRMPRWKLKAWLHGTEFVAAPMFLLSAFLSPLFHPLHEDYIGGTVVWFTYVVTIFLGCQLGDVSCCTSASGYNSMAVMVWFRHLWCNCIVLHFYGCSVAVVKKFRAALKFFLLKIPQSGFPLCHFTTQGQWT